jgi:hypothetical protein
LVQPLRVRLSHGRIILGMKLGARSRFMDSIENPGGRGISWPAGECGPPGFRRHQPIGFWYSNAPVAARTHVFVLTRAFGSRKVSVPPGIPGIRSETSIRRSSRYTERCDSLRRGQGTSSNTVAGCDRHCGSWLASAGELSSNEGAGRTPGQRQA